jgi:hypothetical protein
VRPLVGVHGAHVHYAGLTTQRVEILPAGRLPRVPTASGQRLTDADVAALVAKHTPDSALLWLREWGSSCRYRGASSVRSQ